MSNQPQAIRQYPPHARYVDDPKYRMMVDSLDSVMREKHFDGKELREILELAIRRNEDYQRLDAARRLGVPAHLLEPSKRPSYDAAMQDRCQLCMHDMLNEDGICLSCGWSPDAGRY